MDGNVLLTETQRTLVDLRVEPAGRFVKPSEIVKWQREWESLVSLAREYSDQNSHLFKYLNGNIETEIERGAVGFVEDLRNVTEDEAKKDLDGMRDGLVLLGGNAGVRFPDALQTLANELLKPEADQDWGWQYEMMSRWGEYKENEEKHETRNGGKKRVGWLVPAAVALAGCVASSLPVETVAVQTATPSGVAAPKSPAEVTATQTKIPPGVETQESPIIMFSNVQQAKFVNADGTISEVTDRDMTDACGIVLAMPDNLVMAVYSDHLGYAQILQYLGSHVEDGVPNKQIKVEAICKAAGLDLGVPGNLYMLNTPTPGPEATAPAPEVPIQKMSESQKTIYSQITDIYKQHGIKYFFGQEYFMNGTRVEGQVRSDPGYVVLEIPTKYLSEAEMVLKVGYAMTGVHGTEFLRKVVVGEYCACLWDAQTISINSDIKDYDYTWKRTMPIHEWIHLLDPVFSKFIYTADEALELENIKAELLFHFDPVSVYSDLYANPNGEAWGGNPYYRLGEFVYQNLGNYSSDDALWQDMVSRIREYETDGFSEYDKVRVGRLIFEEKRDDPSFILPGDLDLKFASDFYLQLTYEGFAALVTDIVNGSGSKYSNDEKAIKLVENYMSVVRGERVDMETLRRNLRSLDFELPFQLVESDVKRK